MLMQGWWTAAWHRGTTVSFPGYYLEALFSLFLQINGSYCRR